MTQVLFHPEAETELIAAASWYERKQADLGKRFLSSLEDGISRIRINPTLFPQVEGNVRRCLLRTFPFGILFRVFSFAVILTASKSLSSCICTAIPVTGRKDCKNDRSRHTSRQAHSVNICILL